MDLIFRKTLLFDFYGDLLTKKQKEVYQLYQLDDLSLSEIGENFSISRQGIYDTIKRCDKQMEHLEEILGLVDKFVISRERIELIKSMIEEFKDNQNIDIINKIDIIVNEISDDL